MPWHRTTIAVESSVAPEPMPVAVDGRAVLLVSRDGRWYAFEDRCTHAGCAFSEDGEIDGYHAICDCHGSEFDLRTGRVLRGPARTPLATFPVRVGADGVEVDV